MCSKYSFAATLSHYERQGLTEFNDYQRGRTSKPRNARPVKASKPKPIAVPVPTSSAPQERLRLQESRNNLRPESSLIYYNEPIILQYQDHQDIDYDALEQSRREFLEGDDFYNLYQPSFPPLPTHDNEVRVPQTRERKEAEAAPCESCAGKRLVLASDQSQTPGYVQEKKERFHSPSLSSIHQRRLSNETAIWDPKSPSPTPDNTSAPQSTAEQHLRMPQHPLTPPLTPKTQAAFDEFSLEPYLAELPQPPPIPAQYAEQTPPSSISNGSQPPPSISSRKTDPSRPRKLSLERAGPIPKRSSSLTRTSSKHIQKTSQRSDTFTAPSKHTPNVSQHLNNFDTFSKQIPNVSQHSKTFTAGTLPDYSDNDLFDLEADLDPLPPDLANDPDFAPWLDHPVLPINARVHHLDSAPVSRDSSFDSAAPPPISIGRRDNKERHPPSFLHETPLPKASKPKSSIPFLKKKLSTEKTKGIPYLCTVPGDHPTHIGLSSSELHSIPGLSIANQTALSANRPKTSGSVDSTMTRLQKKGSWTRSFSKSRNAKDVKTSSEALTPSASRPSLSRPPSSRRSSWFGKSKENSYQHADF